MNFFYTEEEIKNQALHSFLEYMKKKKKRTGKFSILLFSFSLLRFEIFDFEIEKKNKFLKI